MSEGMRSRKRDGQAADQTDVDGTDEITTFRKIAAHIHTLFN